MGGEGPSQEVGGEPRSYTRDFSPPGQRGPESTSAARIESRVLDPDAVAKQR